MERVRKRESVCERGRERVSETVRVNEREREKEKH